VEGQRLILLRSSWSPDPANGEPGTIVTAHGDELRVATGRGTLSITELQAEGRRPGRTRDFLAGRRLAPGLRFTSQP
jgi:methionyl-tRNA formyltransferase